MTDRTETNGNPEVPEKAKRRRFVAAYKLRILEEAERCSELEQLRLLNVSNNQLTSIPDCLCECEQLRSLNLSGNRLQCLPDGIGRLSSLRRLELSSNQLTVLPGTIGQLVKVRILYVLDNQLLSLPDSIGQLNELRELYLTRNQLRSLPDSIGDLAQLRAVSVRHNQLSALPRTMVQLPQLKYLNVFSNPDLELPPEIVQNYDSPKTILDYYFRIRDVGTRPLNEAKMLLVGEGGVGKTSLVKMFLDQPFDSQEATTHGIEIHQWQVDTGEQPVRLNVWDFGGQEIMHATHQFFLTARSLYLVVLDSRQNQQQSRIEYWLKLIQTFGGDSPVIAVCNKCDQQQAELDWSGLRRKDPSIRAFARRVSCATGEGIQGLRQLVGQELAQIPHVGDAVPATWFAIKEELEGMRESFIEYSDYEAMCKRQNMTDEEERRQLIGFLHDLGTVMHFHDHPILQDTNILNPLWLTTAVYRILNCDQLLQKKGELLFNELDSLLAPINEFEYPHDKQLFVMEMMKKFELCFDFEEKPNRKFLIPDLLQLEAPDMDDWPDCLRFEIRYDVLPASVISRFIVRMHRLVRGNEYWRKGVVLRSVDGGNEALIRADFEEGIISIAVKGETESRGAFLRTIRDQFEDIHATIRNIRSVEYVAIPEHPDNVVEIDYLKDMKETGQDEYLIPGVRKRVPVAKLLDAVRSHDVFISYSHADKKWLSRLLEMLSPAVRRGRVSVWSDEEIQAGHRWHGQLNRALDSARVGVLLVSPAFLASDFIMQQELPYLLGAAELRKLTCLWVLLSKCLFDVTPIAEIQPAHNIDRPLDTYKAPNRNKVLTEICEKIIETAGLR